MRPIAGNPKIIHRDIKSANILLEDNFEAQASVTAFFLFLFPCSSICGFSSYEFSILGFLF